MDRNINLTREDVKSFGLPDAEADFVARYSNFIAAMEDRGEFFPILTDPDPADKKMPKEARIALAHAHLQELQENADFKVAEALSNDPAKNWGLQQAYADAGNLSALNDTYTAFTATSDDGSVPAWKEGDLDIFGVYADKDENRILSGSPKGTYPLNNLQAMRLLFWRHPHLMYDPRFQAALQKRADDAHLSVEDFVKTDRKAMVSSKNEKGETETKEMNGREEAFLLFQQHSPLLQMFPKGVRFDAKKKTSTLLDDYGNNFVIDNADGKITLRMMPERKQSDETLPPQEFNAKMARTMAKLKIAMSRDNEGNPGQQQTINFAPKPGVNRFLKKEEFERRRDIYILMDLDEADKNNLKPMFHGKAPRFNLEKMNKAALAEMSIELGYERMQELWKKYSTSAHASNILNASSHAKAQQEAGAATHDAPEPAEATTSRNDRMTASDVLMDVRKQQPAGETPLARVKKALNDFMHRPNNLPGSRSPA